MIKLPKFGSFNTAEFFYDLSFEDYSCENYLMALQSEIDNARLVYDNGRNAMGLTFVEPVNYVLPCIDNIICQDGLRILVTGFENQNENGIYVAQHGTWNRDPSVSGDTVVNENNGNAYIKISDGWTQLLVL